MLAAARELSLERGIDSLTMRALAERLGVAPNALYSHVANKAALVDDLLDDVLAEIDAPSSAAADAAAGLHGLMASTYDALLRHPELVPLYVARQGARGPNARRLGDVMIALLAGMGVRDEAARQALRVLIVYTIGFAAFTTHPPLGAGEGKPLTRDELLDTFDNGLRWLLAGIQSEGSARAAADPVERRKSAPPRR